MSAVLDRPTDGRALTSRANAQLSTGPKTPDGKAVVAKNALKHGFFASNAILDVEDKSEFDELHNALRNALLPVGTMEELMVERIAVSQWRYRRLLWWEATTLHGGYHWNEPDRRTLQTERLLTYHSYFDRQQETLLRTLYGVQAQRKNAG